jgi:hypothetical protein
MGISLFALGFLAEAIAGLKEKIDNLDHTISGRKRFGSTSPPGKKDEREN